MTTATDNAGLCALLGHERETHDAGTRYWHVPPTTCTRCGAMFAGRPGVAPDARPKGSGETNWVVRTTANEEKPHAEAARAV